MLSSELFRVFNYYSSAATFNMDYVTVYAEAVHSYKTRPPPQKKKQIKKIKNIFLNYMQDREILRTIYKELALDQTVYSTDIFDALYV